jgi:tetratricopeptide (TPR) repeat protein
VTDSRPPRPAPNQIVADTSPVPPPSPDESTDPVYGQKREVMIALIKESRDPVEKADLLMRLADLEQEMVDSAESRIAEILDRCGEVGCGSADRARLERLEAVRQRHVDEQVTWLDRVVREHETYFRADEALYRLGFTLLEHDQPEVALRHIRLLITRYPKSRWVPSAYLAFGDHYFEREDVDKAAQLYEKVLAFHDPDTMPFAHYKLGWCHFDKQDFKRALDSFVKALQSIRASTAPGLYELREQVLKDLVRAYAQVGKPQMAEKFFGKFADERVEELLEHLAGFYFDEGKYAQSITVHRRLVQRVECSTVQARSQLGIFEANLLLGNREGMLLEAKRLADVFVQLGECLPAEELREFAEVGVEAKETIREQAAQFRAEFDMTQAPAAAKAAEALEQAAAAF